jgi:hypothetical protein
MTKRRRGTKKGQRKGRRTRKKNLKKGLKKGGDPNPAIQEEYNKKNAFRRAFNNLIIELKGAKSNNDIKQSVNSLTKLFTNNTMINTLIPTTIEGKPIDKQTYSLATRPVEISDFVSPIIIIFNNLSGKISSKIMLKILTDYYLNGGDFNNISSRLKITPLINEITHKRVDNVKMLLDKSNPFSVIEDGLDDEVKSKLSELIPNEQKIISNPLDNTENNVDKVDKAVVNTKVVNLHLPYPLPDDNLIGYDRNVVPEFWKQLFTEDELLQIRTIFLEFYETDKFKENVYKRTQICDLLETIIPGYLTTYVLSYGTTPKTLVNTNLLNCFITLLYGIVLYKLYSTDQPYLFMFKGGRAIQLSLKDIPDIRKYFSEDTDILIFPNRKLNTPYDLEKMENLSEHIGYLVKWFIPAEMNIIVSLPTNPKNTNKEITKVLYNDDRLFKPLSDVNFGEINEDIKKHFDVLSYSPFYLTTFNRDCLFITPTLDDMLSEKLFYYAKYSNLYEKIAKNGMSYSEENQKNEYDHYKLKFKRAIQALADASIKKDYYEDLSNINKKEAIDLLLKSILAQFNDYTNEDRERILLELYPTS